MIVLVVDLFTQAFLPCLVSTTRRQSVHRVAKKKLWMTILEIRCVTLQRNSYVLDPSNNLVSQCATVHWYYQDEHQNQTFVKVRKGEEQCVNHIIPLK
jgi:hypothetical protein